MRRVLYIGLAVLIALVSFNIFQLYTGYRSLSHVPPGYALASASSDLDVVEFLDYSCRYCREIHPTIIQAVKRDGGVRYIPRPLPSRNPEGFYAAVLAYAAGQQNAFIKTHNALMENYRVINEDILADLTQKTGLNYEQLMRDIEDDAVKGMIVKNGRLFKKVGGRATPTFIIGDRIFYVPEGRMPTVEDFLKMFNEARAMK